jgi:hypothetical protein
VYGRNVVRPELIAAGDHRGHGRDTMETTRGGSSQRRHFVAAAAGRSGELVARHEMSTLERSLRREISDLRSEMTRLDRELRRQQVAFQNREFRDTMRRQTWLLVAAMYAIAALTWAAIALTS